MSACACARARVRACVRACVCVCVCVCVCNIALSGYVDSLNLSHQPIYRVDQGVLNFLPGFYLPLAVLAKRPI